MTILDEIVAYKKVFLAERQKTVPIEQIRDMIPKQAPARSIMTSLQEPGIRVIAECKNKSPSKGIIAENYNPVELATSYERGGAAAISVLTDEKYFGGSLDDLVRVRQAVNLPILRKDFTIDPYQIYEARAYGADSFLLIAGVLSSSRIEEFLKIGRSLGMEALVESHTESQLEQAAAAGAKLLGINNRNLSSFAVDLDHAKGLISKIRDLSPNAIPVCESGIKSVSDIEIMAKVGYNSFLIGETLVRENKPEAFLQALAKVGPF